MVKITVITVVKNDSVGIEKTIKSVLSQTQEQIEHIVVDGMSNDGTTEIISKYKKKLKHIREYDNGIYQAINKGIRAARGEYIGLLHSGDIYFRRTTLKKALNFIIKKKLDFASFDMLYKNKNKLIRYWMLPIKKLNKYNCFKIAHPTLIIKKKIILNIPYSEKYKISGDYKFLINLSKINNLKFKYKNDIFQINQHGGISTSKKNIIRKMLEDLSIIIEEFSIFFIFIFLYKNLSKIGSLFKFLRKI